MNALILKATYTQKEKSNIIAGIECCLSSFILFIKKTIFLLSKKKSPTDSGVAQAVTVSSFQEELSEHFVTPFSSVGEARRAHRSFFFSPGQVVASFSTLSCNHLLFSVVGPLLSQLRMDNEPAARLPVTLSLCF
ncbi:hypothetical protein ES288_A03G195800v1 [Gossypium darwinii]|uniref:Uncharacterized protein n=1 Tax=Gossypium darwinii TaxID=34276 RepID=A0A5D2H6G8_GOSDA|nr:hypothetical protein ES288_A03G195800v1 [Gossypium darwinii]